MADIIYGVDFRKGREPRELTAMAAEILEAISIPYEPDTAPSEYVPPDSA